MPGSRRVAMPDNYSGRIAAKPSMSTIINTETTITEPFGLKQQDKTIEIGSNAVPMAAAIFGGDSLVTE